MFTFRSIWISFKTSELFQEMNLKLQLSYSATSDNYFN